MGDAGTSGFELKRATVEDLDDLARIQIQAMSWDPLIAEFEKTMTPEQLYAFARKLLTGRMTVGEELGACQTWKVIDENGKMVAWGGLGFPTQLTEEQELAIKGGKPELPPNSSPALFKFLVFWEETFSQCLAKIGYDPAKHFMRQNTMVHPEYQRRGFGHMITKKYNQIADKAGVATFVRARPTSLPLFKSEGFEVFERIEVDYEEYGMPKFEGDSGVYTLKREPGRRKET